MCSMKHYTWNPEKNKTLKKERNVGFEDVVFHIEAGDEVDILEHPNKERYPIQKNPGCSHWGLRLSSAVRWIGQGGFSKNYHPQS